MRSSNQTNQIRTRLRDFADDSLSLSSELLLNDKVSLFNEVTNAIFDICCTLETLFASNICISSQLVKSLFEGKKCFQKSIFSVLV